jgi:hypothetical protein
MNSPEYGDLYSTWRYREIIPMKMIEYVHNLSDRNGNKIDPVSIGMPPEFPEDLVNTVHFDSLGHAKTKMTITEYEWPVGQMLEMSKLGMEQCLDKMSNALMRIYQV